MGTLMKFYRVMVVPTLLETWAAKHEHTIKDQSKIQRAKKGFLQSERGYTTTDRMRNDQI